MYVPDTLQCCIPVVQGGVVHTSYLPAQFKYFAVFKVLLNSLQSSALPDDPFQMQFNCEVSVSHFLSLSLSPSVSPFLSVSFNHSN